MLPKNFNLHFYLKKPKNYLSGVQPIYIRITVDGEVRELCSSHKIEPFKWNKEAQRAIGSKEDVRAVNSYLDTLQTKVYEARRLMVESDKTITAEAIKNILLGREEKPIMILEVFQQHNEQMEKLVGVDYAAGTLERYVTSLTHTKSFIQWKYQATDLDIKKLDFQFITAYEFWLKSERKCNHNSTMKYLANFRKIVNYCIRSGWLTRDPFLGFKMAKKEVNRVALDERELQTLIDKKFSIEHIEQVRDIFVFCCFTGLAYVDVKKLKHSEICTGIDGEKWIYTSRQKTETPSRIPLLSTALAILEKYKKHPQCLNKDLLLPVMSNQKMNAYLKEIADLCGIKKNFTFHIARHTFATTVTLSNGVPLETVSKLLGHRNIKITQQYAKIVDRKVSEDMLPLRTKFQKPKK
jgi:site-specific recombinase XerD